MSRVRNAVNVVKSFGLMSLIVASLLFAVAPRSYAQVDEGSIIGVVQDPTGAVVPGAQVTLLNTDQGITLTITTNSAGEYTFFARQNRSLYRLCDGHRIREDRTAKPVRVG